MDIPPFTPKLPVIPEAEQTPLVRYLLQIIAQQQKPIQRLEDAIRRLKGGPQRPQLKPSSLEPGEEQVSTEAGTEAGKGRPSLDFRQRNCTPNLSRFWLGIGG